MDLSKKRCVPCEGGVMPFFRHKAEEYLAHVPGWALAEDGKSISRTYIFKNFAQALSFGNRVGAIAEEENHHPDLYVSWGKLRVTLTTHAINGLSENDFILAAKIDDL